MQNVGAAHEGLNPRKKQDIVKLIPLGIRLHRNSFLEKMDST